MPKIPEISVEIQMERSVSVRLTGIFGLTSGGGPLISVGIFRSKFAVPFLTNRFFSLIGEFGKGIKIGTSHCYWLAWFNQKMLFHFPRVFLLISDRWVWHNGKHPVCHETVENCILGFYAFIQVGENQFTSFLLYLF